MALQPQEDARRSTEALEAGYVPTGKWLGFGLADFPFDSHDQIVWDHRVFDIIAPPRPMPNHRLNTISHQELDLQEVGEFEAGVDAVATPGVVGGFGG